MPMNLLFNYELLELGVGGGGKTKFYPDCILLTPQCNMSRRPFRGPLLNVFLTGDR